MIMQDRQIRFAYITRVQLVQVVHNFTCAGGVHV